MFTLLELMSLPRIDRNLSDTILDLRESKGNTTLEDLFHVKHLQFTEQLLDMLHFEPYKLDSWASTMSDGSKDDETFSRVDLAIVNSDLRIDG